MDTFISRSPEETAALGESWGREAGPGWVFALSGELGAGKTQLVKGLARGLGVTGRVHSPTFALVNVLGGGRLPLVHLDLYRLEDRESVVRAGLGEYFRPREGVTVVEWAERWYGDKAHFAGGAAGARRVRRVWMEHLDEERRRILHEDTGA
jgi:tRNA threonylcarbamoyladenosine biosynthesis protein TsaE